MSESGGGGTEPDNPRRIQAQRHSTWPRQTERDQSAALNSDTLAGTVVQTATLDPVRSMRGREQVVVTKLQK